MTTTASDSQEPAKDLPRPEKAKTEPKRDPLPLRGGGGGSADFGAGAAYMPRSGW